MMTSGDACPTCSMNSSMTCLHSTYRQICPGYDESCIAQNEPFFCTLLQVVGVVLPFLSKKSGNVQHITHHKILLLFLLQFHTISYHFPCIVFKFAKKTCTLLCFCYTGHLYGKKQFPIISSQGRMARNERIRCRNRDGGQSRCP